MRAWLDWLDARTGFVGVGRKFLFDPIPGGARWRHTWSAALAFAFFMQVVTGFFLLAHYSASTQTAWESVFYLQYRVPAGWLLRGLHSISAQAFVVLLALHVMQTVVHRTYRAPRELNFLLLLALLPLALGLSATGWLLPLDQKGFWAARVPLNILGITPVVGPALQRLLLAGPEFSHHTLTRYVALHTTLLPLLTATGLAAYLYVTHRLRSAVAAAGDRARGVASAPPGSAGSAAAYWPDQALRDAVACLAVLVTVLVVVLAPRWFGQGEGGVELLAPADPTEPYPAARPEWFMLWLFQFLKLFPGGTEVWGAVALPTLVLLVMAAMPWIARWRFGAVFNTGFVLALAAGALLLTWQAVGQDRRDPGYAAALQRARLDAQRARDLAGGPDGIPPAGALQLLRNDPAIQGPKLFARHCASCHRYDGHDGLGNLPKDPPSASELKGFASREWLAGLLDPQRIVTPHYFGGTKFAQGKMVKFVKNEVSEFSPENRAKLAKVVVALSAEANLPAQRDLDARDAAVIAEGRELIRTKEMNCTECHSFQKPDDTATAPDLTGYGSRAWLIDFVTHPADPRFYGPRNDRMPHFGKEEILTSAELGLLADWLRGTTGPR